MSSAIRSIITVLVILLTANSFSQNMVLSVKDIDDMKFMHEEEKLARDVYEFLGEKWNLRIFNNIKQSEQRHLDKMKNLLETNSVTYLINDERGFFYNNDLQKMYDELVEKGSKSKYDALEVGRMIEETDIADLEKAFKNTDNTYIKQVYSNLLRGSQNHLQAFNRQLLKI